MASSPSFPIVGIGASAGGLEAFTQLLRALPSDTGMAFVFVQHLDPTHATVLTDLLAKATAMSTSQVEDGTPVRPDHVYVIPPNRSLTISDGILRLGARDTTHGRHLPIDTFLASLADDQGARAVGVILSGTGSDGAVGLRAIKSAGGVTFAQDERSAQHAGMPHSAVAAGAVDLVLPAGEIAAELARIARHPYVESSRSSPGAAADPSREPDGLQQILLILRSTTGTDFQGYKPATVRRRVARRMLLQRIETFESYARYLRHHPAEVQALHDDLFVTVTRFFRDPDVFQALVRTVFPRLLKERPRKTPIRIWTPGCATGEEAYSILIALTEFLEKTKQGGNDLEIQLFATDANVASIARARAGRYPESIALDVSPERLRRFFVKADGQYQVTKSIRDAAVFAVHNVATDPPFSRLDLLTCRNLLIYLGPDLQRRVLPVFHYALKPTGFLLLGNAETPGAFTDLFVPVDKTHRIYARRPGAPRASLGWTLRELGGRSVAASPETRERVLALQEPELGREADRILLARYAPAGVIVNADLEVLHVRGRTGPYLELPSGAASFNLLKMVREGLIVDVRAAVRRARTTGAPVRKDGVQVRRNGDLVRVNIAAIPLRSSSARSAAPGAFLVLFEDAPPPAVSESPRKRVGPGKPGQERSTRALRAELESTKEYLQAIISEREAANEELQSASEELQSTNEELQSTNEELETSKEELQSVNEELGTINDELQARNAELGRLNSDLANILSSVTIPIVIVGSDLRIRRFTGMVTRVLNVVSTDVGRSILDIRWKIELPDVERVLLGVMETLVPWEHDVHDQEGHWYSARILPYRRIDDKIDGAVMAFVDVDARRQLEDEMRRRADEFEHVSAMKDDFVALLSHELRTPLSAILGWARLLRSGKLDPDRAAHAVEVIQRNTVLQVRLIDDLLDVSRIIAGKLRVERRLIALRDAVEAAVEAHRPAAGAKGVILESALGSAPVEVLGDAVRLQQVVGNLLSNALKFTPEGGRVEVRLARSGSRVQIQVRDTGDGIAADVLPHLFERFRQDERGIARPHAGLGLGLALARYLVEQHDGTIHAESPGPGRGATFTVSLPAAPPRGAEAAPPEPKGATARVEPPRLDGVRALVVEDHDDTREFVAAVLAGYGAEVTTARSVRTALGEFENHKPHVLVSDIAMPGEHGYDLIRAVRARPPEEGGRVPALALTAYARPEDRDRAVAAGYTRHLAKPVDPIDLASIVAQLVDRA